MRSYRDRITIEAGKRGGKPCVRGLRITVYDVLEFLASGKKEEEILEDFPELKREDILACLAFAADREHHTAFIRPSPLKSRADISTPRTPPSTSAPVYK
jgi:uncharacterized protein (DUF433 family)